MYRQCPYVALKTKASKTIEISEDFVASAVYGSIQVWTLLPLRNRSGIKTYMHDFPLYVHSRNMSLNWCPILVSLSSDQVARATWTRSCFATKSDISVSDIRQFSKEENRKTLLTRVPRNERLSDCARREQRSKTKGPRLLRSCFWLGALNCLRICL